MARDWPFQMKSNSQGTLIIARCKSIFVFLKKMIKMAISYGSSWQPPLFMSIFGFYYKKKRYVFTMISMDLIWWNCKLKACQLTHLHRWLQHWRITPVSWSVLIHRWNHPCLRCPRWKMHCTRRCCRLPWCHSVRFFDLERRGKWFWEETCGNKQTRYTCLPVYLLVSVEGLYDIEMLQTRSLTWIPNMMLWKMHLNVKNWRNFEYFGYLLVWFQAVIGLPNHFLEGLVHPITLSTFAAKQCTQQCIGKMVLPL